ncbi:MAG: putative DNA binding domain-containing protein [Gammaproteobacteria bacterium]|nr:putative DNA binding domain-containing protein [Gammaproteobacteria bacterium]
MNITDLEDLIKNGESQTLEFKSSTAKLKNAFETLCAFLNGEGGAVLIGVANNGKIIGQHVTDKTKLEIANMLKKLEPAANIFIEYVTLEKDKDIIVLNANPHKDLQPYTFDGRPYVRFESSTSQMPRQQYQYMTINNMQRTNDWENEIAANATIDDLDAEEIINTVSEGLANGRITDYESTDNPKIALKGLGLLSNGKLTNAAIVLFAKKPTKWFPQCSIRLARFRGIDKAEFIDSKIIDGNVFTIIREAMIFANRYLPVSSRFGSGTLQRIDEPLFHIDALREVFANAVGHRDYHDSSTISFAVYDDRLEIYSPGTLPNGVTFDNIKTLNESKPRNHLIARVLYFNKFFETWGRGVQKIIKLCTKAGHPEPEFVERAGGVCVILRSKQMIGPPTIVTEADIPTELGLTLIEQEILKILKEQKKVTTANILDRLQTKTASRTIQKYLKHLDELELVHKKGAGKNTYWEIVSP